MSIQNDPAASEDVLVDLEVTGICRLVDHDEEIVFFVGNVHQVDHVPNGPSNSAARTTMLPLRLCGGKLLVTITGERRYDPSRLHVNDNDVCKANMV